MELIFIRHGEPAWSVDQMSQVDPKLTERGVRQASLVARHVAESRFRPSEVLVSPAMRAQLTATPLGEAAGIEPVIVDDLAEIRMPDWTGQLEERVLEVFAEARGRPPEEWWDGMPGGESFHAFHDRISTAMLTVLKERGVEPDSTRRPQLWRVQDQSMKIAIVAHAGTNSTALSFLLGFEPAPWEWERFIIGHASIARLRTVPLAGDHIFSLRAFNDREHLPIELRTR